MISNSYVWKNVSASKDTSTYSGLTAADAVAPNQRIRNPALRTSRFRCCRSSEVKVPAGCDSRVIGRCAPFFFPSIKAV